MLRCFAEETARKMADGTPGHEAWGWSVLPAHDGRESWYVGTVEQLAKIGVLAPMVNRPEVAQPRTRPAHEWPTVPPITPMQSDLFPGAAPTGRLFS